MGAFSFTLGALEKKKSKFSPPKWEHPGEPNPGLWGESQVSNPKDYEEYICNYT